MKGSWGLLLIGAAAAFAFQAVLMAQVPVTSGPVIEIADSNSATIAWSTQRLSATRVWYGDDPDQLTEIAGDDREATEHRVRLESLQPNSTYFFQVDSSKSPAETESPAVMSFKTTAPGQAPIHNRKAVIAQRGILGAESSDVQR